MQIINKTVQCSECGCIAFPDSINCPKCGASFRMNRNRNGIREIFEKNNCVTIQSPRNERESAVETYYQLPCLHYGHPGIKAIVVLPSAKCPFCQEN